MTLLYHHPAALAKGRKKPPPEGGGGRSLFAVENALECRKEGEKNDHQVSDPGRGMAVSPVVDGDQAPEDGLEGLYSGGELDAALVPALGDEQANVKEQNDDRQKGGSMVSPFLTHCRFLVLFPPFPQELGAVEDQEEGDHQDGIAPEVVPQERLEEVEGVALRGPAEEHEVGVKDRVGRHRHGGKAREKQEAAGEVPPVPPESSRIG